MEHYPHSPLHLSRSSSSDFLIFHFNKHERSRIQVSTFKSMDSTVSLFSQISRAATQALTSLWYNDSQPESEASSKGTMTFTDLVNRLVQHFEDVVDGEAS